MGIEIKKRKKRKPLGLGQMMIVLTVSFAFSFILLGLLYQNFMSVVGGFVLLIPAAIYIGIKIFE